MGGRTMGTTWSLRFDNPKMIELGTVRHAVQAALHRVVAQMSTWEPSSEISGFNGAVAGSRHALAPEFAKVLGCALHWAAASGGAIDPSVGPLISLWGFGAQACTSGAPPSPADLAQARARVGWERLDFDPGTRSILQTGGTMLDLSGVAKGFAVDHVAEALRTLGLEDFIVEVGGELRGAGHRPGGGSWRVEVDAPNGRPLVVALSNLSIATSGDRWHTHEHAGRRWSHTIDPRSGEPPRHGLSSVTVLHRECMHADALATVLAVLGPEEGLAFAERQSAAALFVCREGTQPRVVATRRWPAHSA
jgi:thiamine biosynthesis lipoprotein